MQIFVYLIFLSIFLISTIAFVLLIMRKQPKRYLALSLVLCLSVIVGACSLAPPEQNSQLPKTTLANSSDASVSGGDRQSTDTDFSTTESSDAPTRPSETTETTSTGQSSITESKPTTTQDDMPGETMTLHFLDVGQGAGTLVQLGSRAMLIDGGGPEASSFVVAYLLEQDISTIDMLVATHYDEDHINGLVGVLTKFNVTEVFDCPYPSDTRASNSFKRIIEEENIKETVPTLGDSFSFGDAMVTFVAPFEYGHDDPNDDSIALMLTYGQMRFLITGDSSADSEQQILDQDLKCDVLLAMHHGSNGSNSKTLLAAANPDFVVISCGWQNAYGHPGDHTLNRIQDTGAHLYRTDIQSTIICTTDGQSLSWRDEPCEDFTPGTPATESTETSPRLTTATTLTGPEETDEPDETDEVEAQTYVLNTNTKKFHYPDCGSVDQMAEKNKMIVTWPRDDIIKEGYVACKNCDP